MRVEQKGDITTIRFASRQFKETARVLAVALAVFPGLLLVWAGNNLAVPQNYWTYVLFLYSAYFALLFFFASLEKKVEIHPERLYARDWILEPEYEYPVSDKMVIMLENFPRIQWMIPREYWRISIGYPDGVYALVEEMGDHLTMRRLAHLLSKKFNAPLIDYTYADQLDIVMFYRPDEVDMPFAQRAVKYPDLLVFGDLPAYKSINEDLVAPDKRVYLWSAFSWDVLLRYGVVAVIAVILVLLNLVSTREDALITIPLGSNVIIYYLILFWFLGQILHATGVRKKLKLTRKKISYQSTFYRIKQEKIAIPTAEVQEVRVKPAPGGFVLMITGKDKGIELRTHLGGLDDFGHLLWLTGRIQDFILENRMAFILEKHQETQKADGERKEEMQVTQAEDTTEKETLNSVEESITTDVPDEAPGGAEETPEQGKEEIPGEFARTLEESIGLSIPASDESREMSEGQSDIHRESDTDSISNRESVKKEDKPSTSEEI